MYLSTIRQINASLTRLASGAPTRGATDPFLAQYRKQLADRLPMRSTPGRLLLVIGTGRNGSTSFAHALRQTAASLVSHERPPLLHWDSAGARLDFHVEFMRISRWYFPLVADVAHWWLPHLDRIQQALGALDLIYLHRDVEATCSSFARIKLGNSPPYNHWIQHAGEHWKIDPWDACYPKVLELDSLAATDDKQLKEALCRSCIRRYVELYQRDAREALRRHGGLEVDIDDLFSRKTSRAISGLLHLDLHWTRRHLNSGDTSDSAAMRPFDGPGLLDFLRSSESDAKHGSQWIRGQRQ